VAADCGFFYTEDGGNKFLRNVGSHKIYAAPHPRRRHSLLKQVDDSTIMIFKEIHGFVPPLLANPIFVDPYIMELPSYLFYLGLNILWCFLLSFSLQ
jgi:hypothetical protein